MTKEDGYKEMKDFICTGCGKTIRLTKFASQKTCRCEKCKELGIPINPDIVAQAVQKNPAKPRKVAQNSGTTKECECINCGKMVVVSKFMSAKKVLCDACKGVAVPETSYDAPHLKPDMSKLDRSKLASMEEYEMNDGIIENRRLREVPCPSCGHNYMKPLMIVDWSPFGLVIDYQCQDCYTKVTVSEQCKHRMKVYNPGKQFDYTGMEVKELGLKWKDSSRMANALCILIDHCEKNNIDIDEILKEFHDSIPPYKWNNDKPVSRGFTIPPEDKWVSTVQTAIDWIDNNTQEPVDIADRLRGLLKEETNDSDAKQEG